MLVCMQARSKAGLCEDPGPSLYGRARVRQDSRFTNNSAELHRPHGYPLMANSRQAFSAANITAKCREGCDLTMQGALAAVHSVLHVIDCSSIACAVGTDLRFHGCVKLYISGQRVFVRCRLPNALLTARLTCKA